MFRGKKRIFVYQTNTDTIMNSFDIRHFENMHAMNERIKHARKEARLREEQERQRLMMAAQMHMDMLSEQSSVVQDKGRSATLQPSSVDEYHIKYRDRKIRDRLMKEVERRRKAKEAERAVQQAKRQRITDTITVPQRLVVRLAVWLGETVKRLLSPPSDELIFIDDTED